MLLNLYMEDYELVKREVEATRIARIILEEFKKSTRGVRALSSYLTSITLFLANIFEFTEVAKIYYESEVLNSL